MREGGGIEEGKEGEREREREGRNDERREAVHR